MTKTEDIPVPGLRSMEILITNSAKDDIFIEFWSLDQTSTVVFFFPSENGCSEDVHNLNVRKRFFTLRTSHNKGR
jgi:hypothetical protein